MKLRTLRRRPKRVPRGTSYHPANKERYTFQPNGCFYYGERLFSANVWRFK